MASQKLKLESMKYEARLSQSEQDKEQSEQQFRVRGAKLQLQADILETEKAVAIATNELDKLKGAYPFNSKAIIAKKNEVDNLTDGLTALKELETELF